MPITFNVVPAKENDNHSVLTRTENTKPKQLTMPYHAIEVINGIEGWNNGGLLIQDACSFMTPDEREFILTGMTSEEWDELFEEE